MTWCFDLKRYISNQSPDVYVKASQMIGEIEQIGDWMDNWDFCILQRMVHVIENET